MPNANEVFRDFERFTGDGKPNAPTGALLPVGDPRSGHHNLTKKDLRDWGAALEALNGNPAALEGRLSVMEGRSTPSYANRAAAEAAASELPTSITRIIVQEGGATVTRARTAFADDPLYATGARWGVVQRVDVAAEAAARAEALEMEATARRAAQASEAAARQQALAVERDERVSTQQSLRADLDDAANALADPIRKDALLPLHRPGDTPWLHGAGISGGDPYSVSPVANVAVSAEGAVARIVGSGIVSDRRLASLEPGRQYGVRFAVRRAVNTPDPSGDAVRLAVACYDRTGGHIGNVTLENLTALTVASGRQERSFAIARNSAEGVIATLPGTIYARPYVQTYGTSVQTDVEVIDIVDVTDLSVWSPDVTEFSSRLSAVESLEAGDRLGTLEAEVGTPATRRYKTLADATAAVTAASVDVIEVLGRLAPGDRGAASYTRVGAEPAHAGKFRSANGVWFEIDPVEIRIEQFDNPADAVSYALAKGRRVVGADNAVALGAGANRSNVIFQGDGQMQGVNTDTPGYRRPIVPANAPAARAMPDRWMLADHWQREANLRVVVLGDSLTTYGADALTAQDGLSLHLERVLRRSNPKRQVEVISRGIGAQRYQEINGLPTLSYPVADRYPWYDNAARPWLDYVADLNPHIVVLSSGMNDQAGFDRAAFESVVAKVTAMASKPQIVIATNMVPNLSPSAAQASFGTYTGQEGRDLVAGYLRTYADFHGYSLIDINRTFGIVRDGRDVCDTWFEALAEEVFSSASRYVAPVEAACRDYTFRGVIAAAAWANAQAFSIKIGPDANNVVWAVNAGGFLRFRFYRGGASSLYREVTSTIPTPSANAVVEITVRGSLFSFRLIPVIDGADAGVKPFTATVIRHGGLFRPDLQYFSGGGAGPVLSAKLGVGKERLYMPSITDRELFGDTSGNAAREMTGGNGANHPTSLGASAIYGLHFSEQTYPMPECIPYGLGEMMIARIDGADTIGAYTVVAGERLRPANAAGAVAASQPAQLTGTLWESRGVAIGSSEIGRTLMWKRIR